MRSLRIFSTTLVIALVILVAGAAGAIAQSPSPTATGTASPTATAAASVKPGPPAPYYAAWGLIFLAGISVLAVLAAYLYHAPGFRQRQSKTSG